MDQKKDLFGTLVLVLAIAMIAQYGVDYIRTHDQKTVAKLAHLKRAFQ